MNEASLTPKNVADIEHLMRHEVAGGGGTW